MYRLAIAAIVLSTCSVANATAMQELNLWRRSVGLPMVVEDQALTAFAQMKAEYRAARMLKDSHAGPQHPPGTREGTGETNESWGCWNTCCMEETANAAGAGVARGPDGERYMVLVMRGGGSAPIGRNIRWVRTFHLTDPVVVGREFGTSETLLAQACPGGVCTVPSVQSHYQQPSYSIMVREVSPYCECEACQCNNCACGMSRGVTVAQQACGTRSSRVVASPFMQRGPARRLLARRPVRRLLGGLFRGCR